MHLGLQQSLAVWYSFNIFFFILILKDAFLVMPLSSGERGFQKAGPFALKLCELIRDLVIGVVTFRGFSELLLRLNRLALDSNCTKLLIGRGAFP